MSSAIEKENLEAHVELCAERYKQLNMKLDSLDTKVTFMEGMISDILKPHCQKPMINIIVN
jgi:hypothetical protein